MLEVILSFEETKEKQPRKNSAVNIARTKKPAIKVRNI